MSLEVKFLAFCVDCREKENLYINIPMTIRFSQPSGRIELESKEKCSRCGGTNFKAFLIGHTDNK